MLGLLVAAALGLLLAGGGATEPPPASAAAALVPADALIYVHLSTDPARPAVRRAEALLARLPDRGRALAGVLGRLVAVVGGSPATDFARDIRPWLGREAAFALLNPRGSTAGSLIALAVAHPARAQAFVARAGARAAGSYGGVRLERYATGAELAFLHGFLVVGQDTSVRAAIDAVAGRTPALAASDAYRRASAGEGAGRVLDAYVSASGASRVLAPLGGLYGELATLLIRPGAVGTAISLAARAPGLVARVHTVLAGAAGHPASAAFTPTLQRVLPAGSTLVLDARNLSSLAPRVLALTGRIGLLSAVPDILHRLGLALKAQGFDVRSVLSLFDGETAIALVRGAGAPALVVVTRTSTEATARIRMAGLAAPLTQIFAAPASGPGVEPQVGAVSTAGVTVHQIQLGPGLQLDYAIFRGLIVVSTTVRGIADVAARQAALGDEPAYHAVLPDPPAQATTLGFAEFSQLLSLGEQTTLARGSGFRALLPDLQRIRAVGLESTRGESDTTAELFLQIP